MAKIKRMDLMKRMHLMDDGSSLGSKSTKEDTRKCGVRDVIER